MISVGIEFNLFGEIRSILEVNLERKHINFCAIAKGMKKRGPSIFHCQNIKTHLSFKQES